MPLVKEQRAKEKEIMGREATGNRPGQGSSEGSCWVECIPQKSPFSRHLSLLVHAALWAGDSPGDFSSTDKIASFLDVLFLVGRTSSVSHPGERLIWAGWDSLSSSKEIQCLPLLPRIRVLASDCGKRRGASVTMDSAGSWCPGSASRSRGSVSPGWVRRGLLTKLRFWGRPAEPWVTC